MRPIPYGHQDITAEDIQAVTDALKSEWLTQGPAVPRFEDAVGEYCGAAHAVAVNSATSALHIACLALGLGPGDWLWTSPNTFVASANCALYCGARVDFVDIDPITCSMSALALAEKLEEADRSGRLPKVVVPVHFAGTSCDMKAIAALARRYEFRIIEDASHAVGARYDGHPVGGCQYSDITVFSFHPVKIITTAEGGMALTNQADIADKMRMLRTHGITRDPAFMPQVPDGPWSYQQVALGFNYRMTDISAALGTSQLRRVDQYVERRHAIADAYDSALHGLPVVAPTRPREARSALHLYVIRIRGAARTRKEIFLSMRERGIGVNVHYIPVHTHPYYVSLGFGAGDFPEAERFYSEAISLPMFPTLAAEDQRAVVEALTEACAAPGES
jgi:UDP-4-amino-4,6-dideoxy-N-acetyl-beta-L-altrosamine transaminase